LLAWKRALWIYKTFLGEEHPKVDTVLDQILYGRKLRWYTVLLETWQLICLQNHCRISLQKIQG